MITVWFTLACMLVRYVKQSWHNALDQFLLLEVIVISTIVIVTISFHHCLRHRQLLYYFDHYMIKLQWCHYLNIQNPSFIMGCSIGVGQRTLLGVKGAAGFVFNKDCLPPHGGGGGREGAGLSPQSLPHLPGIRLGFCSSQSITGRLKRLAAVRR